MGMTKKKLGLACALALSAAAWAGAAPVLTQLTADVMDYDTEKQEFYARGNVKLQRLQMTITADNGEANNLKKTARMWSNVKGFGSHNGEKVDFVCRDLNVDISGVEPRYAMKGDVDATLGTRTIVADTAWLHGGHFAAEKLTRFYDAQRQTTLAADQAEGFSDDQGIRDFTAEGEVYVKQTGDDGEVTELWGDKGVYSRTEGTTTVTGSLHIKQVAAAGHVTEIWGDQGVYDAAQGLTTVTGDVRAKQISTEGQVTEIWSDKMVRSEKRDSITATGHARATQQGRRITARELIYYPASGKLDARGRPQITVDMSSPANRSGRRSGRGGK